MAESNSRAKIGLGTQIIFTQSGTIGEIVSINGAMGLAGTSLDASHLMMPTLDEVNSNGQQIPGGVAQLKDWNLNIHFDSAIGLPKVHEVQTIQLVLPKRTNESSPAKWQATGWVKDVEVSMQPNEIMAATVIIAFTGAYEYTKPTLFA
jgi:hypothetical protein